MAEAVVLALEVGVALVEADGASATALLHLVMYELTAKKEKKNKREIERKKKKQEWEREEMGEADKSLDRVGC